MLETCAWLNMEKKMKTAKERFLKHGGDKEEDPIERLRFFLSLALNSQDWLDVESFIEDIIVNERKEKE